MLHDRHRNSITWFLPVRATLSMFITKTTSVDDCGSYGLMFTWNEHKRHHIMRVNYMRRDARLLRNSWQALLERDGTVYFDRY